MTKVQVEKHGEVIKWFIDNHDKGVWCRNDNTKLTVWVKVYEPNWLESYTYVQNDEYVEFRKAEVEGKVIQYTTCSTKSRIFEKMRQIDRFNRNPEQYRIEPDESTFKVGDWVRNKDLGKNTIIQIIPFYTQEPECYHSEGSVYRHSDGVVDGKYLELWKPQEGEWCVFDGHDGVYYVEKYKVYDIPTVDTYPLKFIQTLKG